MRRREAKQTPKLGIWEKMHPKEEVEEKKGLLLLVTQNGRNPPSELELVPLYQLGFLVLVWVGCYTAS